ncbi:prepilin peptidase [Achromobacter aloeverae]
MVVTTLSGFLIAGLVGAFVGFMVSRIVRHLPTWLEAQGAAEDGHTGAAQAMPFSRCPRRAAWQSSSLSIGLAVLSTFCCARFGWSVKAGLALVMCASLIALAVIDHETGLLPDAITLPLMWLGLAANAESQFVPASYAIWGAVCGYAIPWTVAMAYKKLNGREGMGHGDFKLLAALGAWLGASAVPFILFSATILAILVAITLRTASRLFEGTEHAFGPYLAAVGLAYTLSMHY